MSVPDVSVLLPVRNAAALVGEALHSIERQTFGGFELVVVDDRSGDGSRRIIEEAARRDGRIRLIEGRGAGIADALNRGLEACRAPFIARMDADDIALPRRLERQLDALARSPGLAAVGSQVEIFPREPMSEGLRSYETWLNGLVEPKQIFRERLVESPLVHPAALIRAEALREMGGWRTRGWPEDWALWLSLLEAGWELSNVAEVLLRWRDRPDRLTRTHPDYAAASLTRLKAWHLANGPMREGRCIIWGAGKTGRALSRALAERGVRVAQFIEVDPRQIGRTLHGAKVVSPEGLGAYDGVHLAVAVGAKGARALIRAHLERAGWTESEQFTCAA